MKFTSRFQVPSRSVLGSKMEILMKKKLSYHHNIVVLGNKAETQVIFAFSVFLQNQIKHKLTLSSVLQMNPMKLSPSLHHGAANERMICRTSVKRDEMEQELKECWWWMSVKRDKVSLTKVNITVNLNMKTLESAKSS